MQTPFPVEEYRYRAAIVQRAATELAIAVQDLPRAEAGPAWSGPARMMLDWCIGVERTRLDGIAPTLTIACRQLVFLGDQAASMSLVDCG